MLASHLVNSRPSAWLRLNRLFRPTTLRTRRGRFLFIATFHNILMYIAQILVSRRSRLPGDIRAIDRYRRYETVLKRWPIILTKLIDHVHNVNHKLTMVESANPTWEEPVEEGKRIIAEVSKLKYEMARDKEIVYVLHWQSLRFVQNSCLNEQILITV